MAHKVLKIVLVLAKSKYALRYSVETPGTITNGSICIDSPYRLPKNYPNFAHLRPFVDITPCHYGLKRGYNDRFGKRARSRP